MLSLEDNDLLCRVGAGTPMGELYRRYWLPAIMSRDLPDVDCPPVRVRILGEDLVAFSRHQWAGRPPRGEMFPSAGLPLLWKKRGVRPPLHLSRLVTRNVWDF